MDTKRTSIEKGISIIVPMHNSFDYIERLINNLNSLQIKDAKFEVIFVLNGSFLKEYEYLIDSKLINFDYKILISDKKGAPSARNLGKQFVKYSHVTFLDADDFLSENYIEESFKLLKDDTILITQIHDVDLENNINKFNPVNRPLLKRMKNYYSVNSIHAILGITTCKFIPSKFIEQINFDESLLSGEDTVFYCQLYAEFNPNFEIIPIEKKVIYYRYLSEGSISRGVFSYDFNISQRLDILDILDKLLDKSLSLRTKKFIYSKYKAQTSFIMRYLDEHPEKEHDFKEILKIKKYKHLNKYFLNNDRATELVIAYCFPPFIDTSGIVMAKRIAQGNKIVDVFSNDMSKNRDKDVNLINICISKIDKHIISKHPVSFSNINVLKNFIDDAFLFYLNNSEKYKTVYSRAMFPVSHFPPLFIKLHNRDIQWTAEFSDPLLVDIKSNIRNSEISGYEKLLESLKCEKEFTPFLPFLDNNLFNLAELIPFAFADELIFTNELQLNAMIERFSWEVQELILQKSKISSHPTPKSNLYNKIQSNKLLNKNEFNVGYFGGFYETRSLKMLVDLVNEITTHSKFRINFHIFTSINQLNEDELDLANNHPNIHIYKNVPYLEFLNLTKKMDALLIFDAVTKGIKASNPYLPSKLADYLGSEKPILAIVEKGSILDKHENNLIKKITYDEIESNTVKNIFDENILNLDRKIINDSSKNNIITNYYNLDIEHTNSLKSILGNHEVIFEPILPIVKSEKLIIRLKNNSTENMVANLKSFYTDKKNILKILSNKNEFNNISIGQFIDGKDIQILPGEVLVFELEYNKGYDKNSFKRAGTLLLKIPITKFVNNQTISVK